MRARVGDFTVAESTRALALAEGELPVVHYFPPGDVIRDSLQASGHQTWCPHKGTTQYFHLNGPAGRVTDAAWCYPAPLDQVEAIAGYIAFEPDRVTVEAVS